MFALKGCMLALKENLAWSMAKIEGDVAIDVESVTARIVWIATFSSEKSHAMASMSSIKSCVAVSKNAQNARLPMPAICQARTQNADAAEKTKN